MSNFPYYSTVDQIYHAEWSIPKIARLQRLRNTIETLWPYGHPTQLVQVVGTSGKGSTCRFLETGFSLVGNAGAFMSPHLFDYRERFSINGKFATQEDIHWAWQEVVKPVCVHLAAGDSQHVHSFFEVSILIALALFEKYEVKWAAMEAGVGGRYDQTRALDCVAAVLTNVGTDHAHMLGNEQWMRALDKAGAARPQQPFFTADSNPINLEVIEQVCADAESALIKIGQPEIDEVIERLRDWEIAVSGESLLHADYQKWNAALARAVVRHFHPDVDDKALLTAYANARLLGRFWKVDDFTYADIAHNVEKIGALSGEIQSQFGDRGKVLVLGVSGKRMPVQVFASLAGSARAIIFTGSPYKGQEPGAIQRELAAQTAGIPTIVVSDPRAALEMARSIRQADDVIILTGSTYMIEQALNPDPYLRHMSANFGWRMQENNEASGTLHIKLPGYNPVVR